MDYRNRIFYSKYKCEIKDIKLNNEAKDLETISSIRIYYSDGTMITRNKSILIDDKEKDKKYRALFNSNVIDCFVLSKESLYDENRILPNYTYITAVLYENGIIAIISYNKNDEIYKQIKNIIKYRKNEKKNLKTKEEEKLFEELLLYELLD